MNGLNISSSNLINNSAKGNEAGRGGGILFNCDDQDANYSCSTTFIDNIFSLNTAEVEGGGIATLIASISDLKGCTFENNTSTYGGDVTKTLTNITANKPLQNANSTHLGDIIITVASGQPMDDPIFIYLQDEDGIMITSDSSSTLMLTAQSDNTSMTGNLITATNGNFSLQGLITIDAPTTLSSIYIYIYISIYIYIYILYSSQWCIFN